MQKRIIAAMLCLCMMVTLLPAAAFAAGTGAMAAGTGGISDGSILYFGQYTEDGTVYEVPWRILDADKTSMKTGGAFLISEYLLGSTSFEAMWDGDDSDGQVQPNEWQNSDAWTWCQSFAGGDNFTAVELSAMLATTKTDSLYMDYGASELKGEKAFFLSGEEAETYFHNDKEREAVFITNLTGDMRWWWLRSPYGDKPYNAGVVSVVQRYTRVSYTDGARPAFNLDVSRVLFSSAAQGAKLSGAVGAAALKAVSNGTPAAWKLTLLDSGRSFKAERTAYNTTSKELTFAYTGAATGANEYVSAVIMDVNGAVKYYGNVAKPQSAQGNAKIDLSGVTMGAGDKLYVFSGQINGDKKTDYASALQEMDTGAGNGNGNGNGTGSGSGTGNGNSSGTGDNSGTQTPSLEEPVSEAWVNPFRDMKKGDWFYEAVQFAYEKGMMNGTSVTDFSPHAATTRGMFVTILYRLEGSPEVVGSLFSDVKESAYYADAAAWAQQNGIASGYGNGKFGPNDPVTREQLATLLINYARYKGYNVTNKAEPTQFKDSGAISSYAADAMKWAIAMGLINGNNGILDPKGNAERCQAAAILMRFVMNVEGNK